MMEKANKFLEMTVFVTIVDVGSFVMAAQKLKMSKQAVSRYINALEHRLQVRLLQRTTRTLSLTNEGQSFYQQAKAILTSIDEAESGLNPKQSDPVGKIRVNVPVSFGILHLAPLWKKFHDYYPKIELDITLADRVVDLVDEGYDLAVRIASLPNSTLISRKLATTRVVLCSTPDYIKKHGALKQPLDLLKHKIVAYSLWSAKDEWSFTKGQEKISVHVKPYIYCNNGDTCSQILRANGGISLQPSFIVSEEIKNGIFIEVLPEYDVLELGVYAVYPTRKLLPLRVRCLIDFLVDALKSPPWAGI